ncbi:MAG TPA: T9SS type A sorting domain-containing protein [Draconibacterium sp.]|nr:T9SS type A sorting domain-containing protein [Draconibacterium sp.]
MKKLIVVLISLVIVLVGYCQTDTISENIYQTNGNLGIGTINPEYLIQIEGNKTSVFDRNFIKLHNNSNNSLAYTGIILQTGLDKGMSVVQDYSTKYTASPAYDFAGFLQIGNSNRGIILHARENGIIKFYTGFDPQAGGGIERFRIDSDGNIGIGTIEPTTKLQIADGDIYISDIEKGIIMKSPDGECWRGTLNNAGILEFTKIACPELTSSVNFISNKSKEIVIYPNPTDNQVDIILENSENISLKLQVFDVNGSVIKSQEINQNQKSVNIQNFPSGIYLFKISDNNGNEICTKKIIKS